MKTIFAHLSIRRSTVTFVFPINIKIFFRHAEDSKLEEKWWKREFFALAL
jgi:hypothetical protein